MINLNKVIQGNSRGSKQAVVKPAKPPRNVIISSTNYESDEDKPPQPVYSAWDNVWEKKSPDVDLKAQPSISEPNFEVTSEQSVALPKSQYQLPEKNDYNKESYQHSLKQKPQQPRKHRNDLDDFSEPRSRGKRYKQPRRNEAVMYVPKNQ